MRQCYWEIRGLGVELVAASNETPESNAELRDRLDLPFTLLSDPDARIADAYHAFHHNEPRERLIARPGMFLIDSADNGATIRWEYVGPSSRHRVMPSKLVEEILNLRGQQHQTVSVVVPSQTYLEQWIASLQDPPLGIYRTPEERHGSSHTERDYIRETAMACYSEVHRLSNQGWRLVTVAPEFSGSESVGQRYVFERHLG